MKSYKIVIVLLIIALQGCTYLKTIGHRDLIGVWVGTGQDGTIVKYDIGGDLNVTNKKYLDGQEFVLLYQWKVESNSVFMWGSGCFGPENVIVFYNNRLEIVKDGTRPVKLIDNHENIIFTKET
ncbi:hypothetical protein NBRC116493_27710 [Aurantivibrio infirmus]